MSLLPVGSAESSGYDINNSLRFRRSASAYLSRTPASAGNRKTWTWSGWVKRGIITSTAAYDGLFASYVNASNRTELKFTINDNKFEFLLYTSAVVIGQLVTSQAFRDPTAWYHIILAVDTTQATASNRLKLYINGVQVTAFSSATYPAQNTDGLINSTNIHTVGKNQAAIDYFDGYMAEINFIDGQALTPSSFGSTNATTGVWQPAKYTGTYGTNGFYQKYSSIALTSGSNTGLGQDFSGNGNYFNTTNISVTAGATYDAMTDSPTLTSPTVGNYCVLNNIALIGTAATNGSTSNANLTATTAAGSGSGVGATMAVNMPSGNKWYWEVTPASGVTAAANACQLGVCVNPAPDGLSPTIFAYNSSDSPTYTNGDTISFAYDGAASILYCYKNNVLAKTITSVSSTTALVPAIRDNLATAIVANFNFGQRPFTYTPPAGYVRLNTFNLPTSTIVKGNKVMDATTYTGNGSSNTITNTSSFRPDFVWIKGRSSATNHGLFDSVRGTAAGALSSNLTNAEPLETNLTFASNGFAFSNAGNFDNTNAVTYVGWQWQAGQGSTSSNTSGSITSTVSVNATAGFSIVTYTGTGANATVGHGLGVAPSMVIVKRRNVAQNWQVRHTSIAAANSIQLNLTNASAAATTVWNSTAPTSTVFSIGTSADVNANTGTYVAYCWAEIAGFSNFGSYTGNGNADGPFVYTGFRPKFVLFKQTNAVSNWYIYDSVRNTSNLTNLNLNPNATNAEFTAASVNEPLDLLSNGFKLRGTGGDGNASGATYIYAAFAENPFKNALAR